MPDSSSYRFSDSHEWFSVDGDLVTIGISKFAVDELTDITYVEMKPVGTAISAGDTLGEVESVKTTSDVYSVVNGEIAEVNTALEDNPGLVNEDPLGSGWLVRLRAEDVGALADLMDRETYDAKHPVS
jgi:glycine cleavage system H protein